MQARKKNDLRSALYKTIIVRDGKVLHAASHTFGVPHMVCCMPRRIVVPPGACHMLHIAHCRLCVVRYGLFCFDSIF